MYWFISAIRSGDYYMFDNIEDEEDIEYIQKQEESKGLKSDDVTLGEVSNLTWRILPYPMISNPNINICICITSSFTN